MIEKKTTRDIVFKHIRQYYPDDKRWDIEEWVSVESLLKRLSESASIQEECEDFEEAWNEIANFLTELTKELKR